MTVIPFKSLRSENLTLYQREIYVRYGWHLQRDLLGHAIWSNRSVNCCLSYQAVLSLVLYQDVNSLTNFCFSVYYMEFLFNFQRCAV